MEKEKISIVIPIYNAKKYIKRCLETIIKQTYKNLEIICVNDGSEDNSLAILQEYKKNDNRIVIIDKKNEGVSSARNAGIMASTGKYVTFVDADDWLELDAIEVMYKALMANKADVVRSNYCRNFSENEYDSIGNLYNLSNKLCNTGEKAFSYQVIDRLLVGSIPCYIVLLLIKRECLLKTSLFKEDIYLMEDMIFYIKLLCNVKNIYFLDKVTYHYFCNEDSCMISTKYNVRNMYNMIKVNKYIKELIINSKFYNGEKIEKINTLHLKLIMDYLFSIYRNDKTMVSKEYTKLINNEEFNNLLKTSNISDLPMHFKLPIILVKKRKYNTLILFYRFRNVMSKIKYLLIHKGERNV